MAETVKKVKEISAIVDTESFTLSFPDREAKIAEFAYYKAENRNFIPGYELEDWLEAERELLLDQYGPI
jgi:hypothetical protein